MNNPTEKKSEKLKTGSLIDRGVKGLAKLLLTGESDELKDLGKEVKAAAIEDLNAGKEEAQAEEKKKGTIEVDGRTIEVEGEAVRE